LSDLFLEVSDDISRARYELESFLVGGGFDLYEDGRLVAAVEAGRSSAEISYSKLILYCWGDGWSRSWRVVACATSGGAARLRCAGRMNRAQRLLELRRGTPAAQAAPSRDEFAEGLASLIEARLSGFRVESARASRDDARRLSGIYARLVLKDRDRAVAAIGVSGREPQSSIDAALGAGLIWLDRMRLTHPHADRLIIFAPRGRAATLATRLTMVRPRGAAISLYEVDEASRLVEPVAAFDQGDLADNLRRAALRARWPRDERRTPPEVAALTGSITRLAPDLIESRRRAGSVELSIKGLEFARISVRSRRVEFGLNDERRRLDETNLPELEALVTRIVAHRRAGCDPLADEVCRMRAERWLESIIRRDVTAIDPALDPRYAYSQVPVYRGERRTFIDLLAATKKGRLVIMELKVAEDAEFPFQGLDYWLRVEWHRRRRDFERRGYFGGLKLADAAPLIYLVAPLLRFHGTTRLIARSIANSAPVYRIGINEDWRSGVRVRLAERLNG
jgi:hypothetical protein